MCYVGLAVSLFPYIVAPSITLWEPRRRRSRRPSADRHAVSDADYLHLYGMVVLGLPRESPWGCRLSLARTLRRATTRFVWNAAPAASYRSATFRAQNVNEHVPYRRRSNRGKRTHP